MLVGGLADQRCREARAVAVEQIDGIGQRIDLDQPELGRVLPLPFLPEPVELIVADLVDLGLGAARPPQRALLLRPRCFGTEPNVIAGMQQTFMVLQTLRSSECSTMSASAATSACSETMIHAPPVPCRLTGTPCCRATAPSWATAAPEPARYRERDAFVGEQRPTSGVRG